jgi:hypothetical protein
MRTTKQSDSMTTDPLLLLLQYPLYGDIVDLLGYLPTQSGKI